MHACTRTVRAISPLNQSTAVTVMQSTHWGTTVVFQ